MSGSLIEVVLEVELIPRILCLKPLSQFVTNLDSSSVFLDMQSISNARIMPNLCGLS